MTLSEAHGLSGQTVEQIRKVLARFPDVEAAMLFGSRARGTHKNGSDIDVALHGIGLGLRVISQIEDALDDLLLPYSFSLFVCDARMNAAVADQIARFGIPFYKREGTPVVLAEGGAETV